MHFIDAPLLQQKAHQHLESEAYRWQQANGYTGINFETRSEFVAPPHGTLAALRVTVSQYGSKVLVDSRLFELRLTTTNQSLMPNSVEVAA